MCDIDYIMYLIDWERTEEEQKLGIKLARKVKTISAFLQPKGKNLWDNCAIILSEKSDEELKPYLSELFEWLEDLNWPGAFCIWNRLREYKDKEWFDVILNYKIEDAIALNREIWLDNLLELKKETDEKTGD